jgi:hypothetical protein
MGRGFPFRRPAAHSCRKPLKSILHTRKIVVPTPFGVAISAPARMAIAVGITRRNPLPVHSAKGAGVLGSQIGHPFFVVDDDTTKPSRWHPMEDAPDSQCRPPSK